MGTVSKAQGGKGGTLEEAPQSVRASTRLVQATACPPVSPWIGKIGTNPPSSLDS
jgi:hypothetical protein